MTNDESGFIPSSRAILRVDRRIDGRQIWNSEGGRSRELRHPLRKHWPPPSGRRTASAGLSAARSARRWGSRWSPPRMGVVSAPTKLRSRPASPQRRRPALRAAFLFQGAIIPLLSERTGVLNGRVPITAVATTTKQAKPPGPPRSHRHPN